MKLKLLLTSILFSFIISAASAQTSDYKFYIGGSMSYNYNSFGTMSTFSYTDGYINYYTTKVGNFNISPEFGFMLNKKWSVGVQPIFSHTSGTESSYYYAYSGTANNTFFSDNYKTNSLGLGINVRYYAMITDRFGFFPQFGLSTLNNLAYPNNGSFNIGVSPNFVFFATPKLGINLGFGDVAYSLDYKTKDHTFNANLNNNIVFGLNYYWGRK
jgi:hypothetical protein